MTSRALCGLFAACSIALSACHTPRTTATAWDYRWMKTNPYPGDLHRLIDELAAEGWEYVPGPPGSHPDVFVVFRRPRQ
jgi:hypothetical protein